MIQITPQMRVLVAVEAADFRRGIDGLAQMCRASMGSDPFDGAVFVFRNRSRTAIKLLVYDGQGFWLCHNQPSSHYTSFDSRRGPYVRSTTRVETAARSRNRSQRLQCFTVTTAPTGPLPATAATRGPLRRT
jgi:transposase